MTDSDPSQFDSPAPQRVAFVTGTLAEPALRRVLDEIETAYGELQKGDRSSKTERSPAALEQQVRQVIRQLDGHGRWISTYAGGRLVGQPKFRLNTRYIASQVFSRNIGILRRRTRAG